MQTTDAAVSQPQTLSLLGFRTQTQVTAPNGMVFHCVDHREIEGMYREIFEENVYGTNGITFHEGMTVFDVGANVGMFATYANHRCPSAKIFCFEPIPPTFKALEKNVKEHNIKNAKLFNMGVSDKPGSADFTFYVYSAGWSTMHKHETPDFMKVVRSDIRSYDRLPKVLQLAFKTPILGSLLIELIVHFKMKSKTFHCQLKTLSDVMKENKVDKIDLLKVDVERAEYAVLSGISDADWKRVGQCIIETQDDMDPQNTAKITALLKKHGFDVLEVRAKYLIKEDGKSFNATLYATRKAN